VKQTDFGIKPPGKAGVRAKDEVKIEFDVRLSYLLIAEHHQVPE
jgi:hypothetical protein